LEDENRQITFLIHNLKDDNQQQNTQIVAMQNEIRMLSQTVEEIEQIMDAANAQHESSLGIQVEANRELADEYYRIRDREENLKEQIKRLRERVTELNQSELDQSEEIIQANELIASLEMRLENSKEIISRLEFEAEASNLEKVQAKDEEIQRVRFDYEETIENLRGLLSEKEITLAEKQRTIYNLTSHVEEVSAELEKTKIESREEIERIVHDSLVEIEKINNQLTDEKRVKEEKINEIIAASQVKIEAARAQVKETEEGAENQINEIQRQLDNSIREKYELESQFERTQANARQELIQQIEEAEEKISDLRVQLAEAKNGTAATLNDLERQVKETEEGAENEKSVMKDKIKRMQFMNLVYLIKLRKLNQIILDNRAKLSFESAKGEEMQLSDEELHELLSEIQNAEDNKTLLLENPFNHIAESIYKKSEIIIQTQGNATHNVNVFIETVEEAKSKITELEGQLVTNNKDLDGVKSAFAKLQNAYEEKNTQLTSIQNELVQSTREMSVHKHKANSIIRALRDESERKQKEIKDAVHEKISELTADKEKAEQQLSDEKSKSDELEEKIKKLKEKAKKDVAEIKEKYEGKMVSLSEKDTLLRRISQKEENVTRIKKELEKAKSITATASNKIALQDTIIVELRNEMDALKEKMKSKEQMLTSISELTEQCDALYKKTIANEDQAHRELLAIQRVAEGASRIHELTKQLGENNASRINDLENIRIRLKALLDTPNGITRNGINSIFNAL
jgi:chromosome segregation ATPase